MNGMAGTDDDQVQLVRMVGESWEIRWQLLLFGTEPSYRDANNIVPTLAFQLSQSCPAYRSALCKVLKEEL